MVLTQPTELRVALPLQAVAEECRRYDVAELWVFGSALRSDFGPGSDVDFMVRFDRDDSGPLMSKLQGLEESLATLIGRPVDVVDRRGVERSRNAYRRDHILRTARLIYEQR